MKLLPLPYLLPLALLAGVACGQDDDAADEPGRIGDACSTADAEQQCESSLSCDPLADGSGRVCGTPVTLSGQVTDALTGDPIAEGRVVALSQEGAPVGDVATTTSDGGYVLRVPATRNADGSVAEQARWTLVVAAQGYQIFPAGPRPAIPIAGTQITGGEDPHIEAANTSVTLLPLADAAALPRQIAGTIDADDPGGTLMVAEGGDSPSPYGIADRQGGFVIFNVPAAELSLAGYKQGQQLERVSVDAREASVQGTVMGVSGEALATVDGSVNIVNAPGGSATSVVLVPQSVFDSTLERGPVPLGLRAPGLPEAPTVQSGFEFPGVPSGDYVVLAAFENDNLVRDPDTGIGGTTTQTVSVADGQTISMAESFKVTEHLAVLSPGAEGPETVSGEVTFRWADDSSEDRYALSLYTALGDLVWENAAVPSVSGGDSVELLYSGPALVAGMVYQFRVTSLRDRQSVATPISRTEDLRGVFQYE